MLKNIAEKIMAMLDNMPEVKSCALYGSLTNDTYDELSDIDINIDVSGSDNGQFMLTLAERIGEKISVFYSDYAPSLVPENTSFRLRLMKTIQRAWLICAAPRSRIAQRWRNSRSAR